MPTESHDQQNAEDAGLLKSSLAEVDRYRSMDRLIPSPHNVVTIAALEVCYLYDSKKAVTDVVNSFILYSPLQVSYPAIPAFSSL